MDLSKRRLLFTTLALPLSGFLGKAFSKGKLVRTGGATSALPLADALVTQGEISYAAVGSGAGLQGLEQGTIELAFSDMPVAMKKLREREWIQIPVMVSALALVTSTKRELTPEDLGRIFSELRQNQDPLAIVREEASGSSWIISEYLGRRVPKIVGWTEGSLQPAWKGKVIAAKGSGGVAKALREHAKTIAYLPYDYAVELDLPICSIRREFGSVSLTDTSVNKAIASADWENFVLEGSGTYPLDFIDSPNPSAWPLASGIYAITSKKNGAALAIIRKLVETEPPKGLFGLPKKAKSFVRTLLNGTLS